MKKAAVLLPLFLTCCTTSLNANPAVVPTPQKLELREGQFTLRPTSSIHVDVRSRDTGKLLAERLRVVTGYAMPVLIAAPNNNTISISVMATGTEKPEGYTLETTESGVTIRAVDTGGALYGVMSLLQLLPPSSFSPTVVSNVNWVIPSVSIEDYPRFPWRGLLLDVARHFYSVAEVERVMDLMALHKLNRLQLHLVDDQGWRLEITKHPRLTEVSAWRRGIGFGLNPMATSAYSKDGRYGGFYTHNDVRRLVQYAARLNITLVPEIEMPGHASGALAAYPEYSCHGGPYNIDVGGGVFDGVFCAGKETTFEFLEDVIDEVTQLFPSRYIHIGGDEVPKKNWQNCAACQARMKALGLKNENELQSYFIHRVQSIITARDRTIMGWSEIREGGLAKNAALMDWIGGGKEAAMQGHDVVMTPTGYCYLDYYQSTNTAQEPKAIGGYIPLEKVYSFEPVPSELPESMQGHILGAQGNLWTEYIASPKHVEYMLFPRACALAEVAWSAKAARNYEDFITRLKAHSRRLNELGVFYRPF
jgi:hexosaminidase